MGKTEVKKQRARQIERETDRQDRLTDTTDRQTRQTDLQRHADTERQGERPTETEKCVYINTPDTTDTQMCRACLLHKKSESEMYKSSYAHNQIYRVQIYESS